VEGLLRAKTGALAGPKGSVTGAEGLVLKELLPEPLYSQAALEGLLGTPLETVFAGNASQLRCLAVAAENGAHATRACTLPMQGSMLDTVSDGPKAFAAAHSSA
jgi:hypothetical protein